MRRFCLSLLLGMAFCGILPWLQPAAAQYFGRNKVQYDDFEFRVLETEHFIIHFYPEEEQAVRDAARMAERWYRRHSRTFLREFGEKKPIIFYANDADFQQTNAIQGSIGEGTGGVTESIKQRVIMPMTGIYAETDHVLGHELVHSFQYDIALSRNDSTRFSLGLLPLWLIEGMAEYLSVGREDAHTAMWIRDAAIRDDLPSIDDLSTGRYFPYRYGQAYMAYIGGKYGDASVASLYKLAGRTGLDSAFVYVLGITPDSLSNEWIAEMKEAYLPLAEGRTPADSAGHRVLAGDIDSGDMNIAPAVSPDGQYVAYLSERDLFNINLFIADAETGEVLRKLKGTASDAHFDALRFINSSGSWSPDGQRFAFVTFVQGDNEISILDVNSGKIKRRIAVEGIGAISNPAWSPDGRTLAFTGLDGGISDLYLLDLETNAIRQLTDDRYADLQPAWSPDGRTLAFITDRGPEGTDFETLRYARMRIGLLDTETNELKVIRPFGNAQHTNPQFAPDGRSLFFISDWDGFKDVYRYDLTTGQLARVTKLQTGVSGITALSPAMTVAQQSGRMMFSVFSDNRYTVFSLEPEQTQGTPLTPEADASSTPVASILPPLRAVHEGLVGNYLSDPSAGLPAPEDYPVRDYSNRLRLDYVAPPSVGVSMGGFYGGGMAGGVGFFFSDMLGNQNLALVAQANGTFKDIGGQVSYLNQTYRFNYGASASHIPLLYGRVFYGLEQDPETGAVFQTYNRRLYRIFISQASVGASYPLTTTRRFELSTGFRRYGFDVEEEVYYLSGFGVVGRERRNRSDLERDPFFYFQGSAAYVVDYSFMGFTSPVRGGRQRFQVTPLVGTDTYVSALADYRRYFFAKPFTFAFRGLHIGNYGAGGSDEDGLFTEQYLGYTYYPAFVRGYSFNSFETTKECAPTQTSSCPQLDRLYGTHVGLVSAEIRVPLFGTEELGLIKFPYLPTELSLFFDAGIAWNGGNLLDPLGDPGDRPVLEWVTDPDRLLTDETRIPVASVGASTRFNLFGYMVLEMFYAYPFQRPEKGAHFGFQLLPGW